MRSAVLVISFNLTVISVIYSMKDTGVITESDLFYLHYIKRKSDN